MPEELEPSFVTRSTSRSQKRKRSVPVPISVDSDSDSDQSSADSSTIQSSRGLLPDSRTKKKVNPNPQHELTPTVNTTSAEGQPREDTPVTTTQLKDGDWLGLTSHILQELKERLGPSGGDLPVATKTFLCEKARKLQRGGIP
ncbi:hypothetical protein INS49_015860 [Diaporthe citri]|uniref:uncharacterized protein n=1 Tax=Diaporthe citri TaxID=83186 RepID=UPI001C7FD975|nr:uncharacterized protein INS49_015860 [Diaporthe citri]KAG6356472.1 hypothetical protein INS49_015860 [Diaporthe citri]